MLTTIHEINNVSGLFNCDSCQNRANRLQDRAIIFSMNYEFSDNIFESETTAENS